MVAHPSRLPTDADILFPEAQIAATAMEQGLRALKATGEDGHQRIFDVKAFCAMIGFEDVWAFEKTWAKETA